jgi:hypothetical protein
MWAWRFDERETLASRAPPEDGMTDVIPKAGTTLQVVIPTSLALGTATTSDLSRLPEDEQTALLIDHYRGILEISRKATELHEGTAALRSTFRTLAEGTKMVADSGSAVTVSHTQTTSIGRTEIMTGNTEKAWSGRFSKSQTGERDWTPIYIIGGLIAVVLIAAGLGS